MVVRYDSDSDEGEEWAEIRFDDILRFTYRDFSILGEEDIMGHDYFVEETDSPELRDLREKRTVFLGFNEHERTKDATAPINLYRLYFDDVGAIEVLARSFSVTFPLPDSCVPKI